MAENVDPAARITELHGRLADLSAEELAELRGLVAEQIANAEAADLTTETVEQITRLADIAVEVGDREQAIEQAAAELQRQRDDALGRARGALPAPVDGGDGEEQPETDSAEEPAEQPEPVAASARPAPRPLRSFTAPAASPTSERPVDRQDNSRIRASLTAGGEIIHERSRDEQLQILADQFDAAFRAARRSGSDPRPIIASARYDLPHSIPVGEDAERNRSRMDAAYQASLTASGGICRPGTVDYNIPTWSNQEEPVKAALPSIGAPRGVLQYMAPVPYDATVFGAGVSVWTEANDINPGGANTGPGGSGTGPGEKPCIEIDCSSTLEAVVEAITQCATVGNMRGRFSPENVEVLMTYLQQAFVSLSERERLRQMRAFAKHVTFAITTFGASRDILNAIDRINAYFRSVYRLSSTVPLRIVWQSWVREVIRTDLAKAAFPYEGDSGNSLAVSDAQIDAYLAVRNLMPIWALDDDTGDQTFAKATAGTSGSPSTFPAYPNLGNSGHVGIRAILYPEGTYQRLDGGTLDLGVVRDSALNAVNKYQVFSESFEVVAPRGFEALDVKFDVIPSGATAGTVTPA